MFIVQETACRFVLLELFSLVGCVACLSIPVKRRRIGVHDSLLQQYSRRKRA